MTRAQTSQIMAILQAAFPAYYRNLGREDATAAVNLWAEMFSDDNANEVAAAVKMLIATQVEGYPPTIGAVKQKLLTLREPDRMSAQEAWALATKAAAGNLAWSKLPPLVQRAIGSETVLHEWGLIDSETFGTVIYSQFLKAYGTHDKREQGIRMLPGNVRTLISGITDALRLGE